MFFQGSSKHLTSGPSHTHEGDGSQSQEGQHSNGQEGGSTSLLRDWRIDLEGSPDDAMLQRHGIWGDELIRVLEIGSSKSG